MWTRWFLRGSVTGTGSEESFGEQTLKSREVGCDSPRNRTVSQSKRRYLDPCRNDFRDLTPPSGVNRVESRSVNCSSLTGPQKPTRLRRNGTHRGGAGGEEDNNTVGVVPLRNGVLSPSKKVSRRKVVLTLGGLTFGSLVRRVLPTLGLTPCP